MKGGIFVNKTKEKKSGVDTVAVILVLAIVVVAVVSVNCYIEKYEKDYELGLLQAEIEEAQNDYALLQVEYQKRIGYFSVSEYAENELGMTKISPYQIEYLDRGQTDTMQVVENDEEMGFAERVSKVFSVVLEYFK